jgi:phosphatidylcholine synthase
MSDRTDTGPPAAFAWLVHAFTASGAVLAFLALMAIEREQWRLALLWLLIALAVDGVDGAMARWARVKDKAARIDGDTLDLIIDYLTYVFVPTALIWRAGLVPETLALPAAALIQLSALYHFTRRDLKTGDNYFRGFPALWHVVALYLVVAEASPEAGAVTVVIFSALSFAPVLFVHPFRVRDYGKWLPVLAILWALATVALLWPRWSDAAGTALLAFSLAAGAVLMALGLIRTVRGPRPAL